MYKVQICGVNTAKLPVLDNREKEELLIRAKEGDAKARDKIIRCNLRLVLSVVQRFIQNGEDPDDSFSNRMHRTD